MTRCEMCGYYWTDEGEEYSCCHYDGPSYWAPCELDELYEDDDYDYE